MLHDYRRWNILFLSPLAAWRFNPGTLRARQPPARTHHTSCMAKPSFVWCGAVAAYPRRNWEGGTTGKEARDLQPSKDTHEIFCNWPIGRGGPNFFYDPVVHSVPVQSPKSRRNATPSVLITTTHQRTAISNSPSLADPSASWPPAPLQG